VAYTSFVELSQASAVYELVRQAIDRVNQTLPAGARVKKYVNLHREFDPDERELTRNLKLRRVFLKEHYRSLIDAIYGDQLVVPIETQVGSRERQTGKQKITIKIETVEGAG
jgi:long-chain acyl-CoA synthetase